VRAGYQAILAREPDAAGLASQAGSALRGPTALAQVLRAMLDTPEAVAVNRPLLLSALGRVETSIVSLGTHCFTSEFLKRQGLRAWAGPFDWVFSTIPMVAHCIRDDFASFLDRSQYRPVPVEHRRHGADVNRVDHAYYLEHFGVQRVFNHHDVHEDADYAYITRCVERFRGALRGTRPALFVCTVAARAHTLAQVQALADAVHDAGGGRHRVLAVLVDDAATGRLAPQVGVVHDDARLLALRFESMSAWQPLEFEDPLDELVLAKVLRDAARALTRSTPQPPRGGAPAF